MTRLRTLAFATLLARALVLAGALAFASSAWAQTVIAVTEEAPPYNFRDPASKKVSGMSTEVVQEVFKRAKVEYQLDVYPWARAYQMAQDDANVLIYSIGRSESRESLFKWVGVIAPFDVYLYRLKSRPEITAAHLADAKKYRIGAVRDDVRAQYLLKAGITPDLVTADPLNAKKLESGRIDMFPIDELSMVAVYKREGLDPGSIVKVLKLDDLSTGLYMAFSLKTDEALVRKIKAALEQVKSDGTFDRIRAKYLN